MTRIEEIRARCESASPGPWKYYGDGFDGYIRGANNENIAGGERCEGFLAGSDPDVIFIIHAREDIPYLLGKIEHLQAEQFLLSDDVATLEVENKRLKAERNAATADIERCCDTCLSQAGATWCDYCLRNPHVMTDDDRWQWRGLQGEEV